VSHGSPLISIVIPTWNRPTLVARLVGAINAADDQDDLDIVVVDNDSEDKKWTQLQQVAASHKNVRLYRNPFNIGMTPNWNKAIEYARGEWVVFMCDDDMFMPDSIERIDAAGDYMCIMTGDNTLILRETMKDLEKRLDPRRFQRVHRSTIVNLDLVKQVKPHTNGECFLVLNSGAQVKVSRSYRDVVARFVH